MTDSTISASPVIETSATDSGRSVNATLLDLIQRAEQSAANRTTNTRNRALLSELSFTVVALAQRIAELQTALEDKPRIVLP